MNKRIAVIDAETDPFCFDRLPQPFLWGFYDGNNYEQFTNTDELIAFLAKQDDLIVYAHNGGRFDFHFFSEHINLYEELMIVHGRLAKFKIGECEIRDSWLILPIPLGDYKKDEIDYEIFEKEEREKPHNWKKISNYLYGDCIYLYDIITKFAEQYDLALTMASASMKQWEKISGRKPPRSNAMYYALLKPYYYGGRVECFRAGEINEEFKLADINSAYPYAMLFKHPISTDYEIKYRVPDNPDVLGPSLVKVECVSKGAFPYKSETGKLIFPNDSQKREFFVTGWELIAALKTNTIKMTNVKEVRIFEETIDFADYINHFYELRLEAKRVQDKANDIYAKLFMNSLYGKFASNPDKYRKYLLVPLEFVREAEADGYSFGGELGGWAIMERRLDQMEKNFFNIATSASITGFVRAYLWNAICQSEGVIYCDTDSIVAKEFGNIPYGDQLGAWKIELECDYGAVAGKKLYAYHSNEKKAGLYGLHTRKPCKSGAWKIATKGARLTPKEVIKVAQGEEIMYYPEVPTYSINRPPRFVTRRLNKTA